MESTKGYVMIRFLRLTNNGIILKLESQSWSSVLTNPYAVCEETARLDQPGWNSGTPRKWQHTISRYRRSQPRRR